MQPSPIAARKRRVLVVDDHPLMREGLKAMIDRSTGYMAVAEAGTGEEALQAVVSARPDIVTMDVTLPGMGGIDTIRELRRLNPDLRILTVSMHSRFEYVADAFRAGANGYLVKEATGTKLIQAFDALMSGQFYLDGHASHEVIDKLLRGKEGEQTVSDERYALLTPREQQVMRLLCEGHTSRRISEDLSLSLKTVENHKTNLMKKLDVHSKMELLRYAARLGIIDVEQWK
jgi:DNA-binding NarL/FixJ family response regulator